MMRVYINQCKELALTSLWPVRQRQVITSAINRYEQITVKFEYKI